MAAIAYREPGYAQTGGTVSPLFDRTIVGQNVTFRRGALLVQSTTGSISVPTPQGSMAALAGPPLSAVTFGTSASAGAPPQTIFHYLTYTATSNESLVAGPYVQNVPAGFVYTVNVASAGAPAAATNFADYAAVSPTIEALQQATKTTTALGATFTGAYPLTNSIGAASAATNVASGLIGMADVDSNANFFSGVGGSATIGNTSLLGAQMLPDAAGSIGALAIPIVKLSVGLFEFSLVQAYFPASIAPGTQVGILLDATTGWHVADTSQSNKVAVIRNVVTGPSPFFGQVGDTGARVQVQFLAAAIS